MFALHQAPGTFLQVNVQLTAEGFEGCSEWKRRAENTRRASTAVQSLLCPRDGNEWALRIVVLASVLPPNIQRAPGTLETLIRRSCQIAPGPTSRKGIASMKRRGTTSTTAQRPSPWGGEILINFILHNRHDIPAAVELSFVFGSRSTTKIQHCFLGFKNCAHLAPMSTGCIDGIFID